MEQQTAPVLTPKLDIPAAAAFLGVAVRTLANPAWRARLAVPFYRVGDRILFDSSELAEWFARHRCG